MVILSFYQADTSLLIVQLKKLKVSIKIAWLYINVIFQKKISNKFKKKINKKFKNWIF